MTARPMPRSSTTFRSRNRWSSRSRPPGRPSCRAPGNNPTPYAIEEQDGAMLRPVSFCRWRGPSSDMARLTIRIDLAPGAQLGPGKVRLLELVAETGSIRKAAAGMKMSYRQAWLLLKALASAFGEPLVATATGGRAGGGAHLTALGG